MALAPGTMLGQYEILALISVGGMGEVYRAHDTVLDREVALKLLPEQFASEQETTATQFNVVLNWFEELKRKVPAGK